MAARKSKTTTKRSKKAKSAEVQADTVEEPAPQGEPDNAGSMIDAGGPDFVDTADVTVAAEDPDDVSTSEDDGDDSDNIASGGPAELPGFGDDHELGPVRPSDTDAVSEDAADAGPAPHIDEILPDLVPAPDTTPSSSELASSDAADGGKAPEEGPDAFLDLESGDPRAEA